MRGCGVMLAVLIALAWLLVAAVLLRWDGIFQF